MFLREKRRLFFKADFMFWESAFNKKEWKNLCLFSIYILYVTETLNFIDQTYYIKFLPFNSKNILTETKQMIFIKVNKNKIDWCIKYLVRWGHPPVFFLFLFSLQLPCFTSPFFSLSLSSLSLLPIFLKNPYPITLSQSADHNNRTGCMTFKHMTFSPLNIFDCHCKSQSLRCFFAVLVARDLFVTYSWRYFTIAIP